MTAQVSWKGRSRELTGLCDRLIQADIYSEDFDAEWQSRLIRQLKRENIAGRTQWLLCGERGITSPARKCEGAHVPNLPL